MTALDHLPVAVAQLGDSLDHWACCDGEPGKPARMLCGAICIVDVDDTGPQCLVCLDLEAADYCPRYGRCPHVEGEAT